jgi:hypothetical protein
MIESDFEKLGAFYLGKRFDLPQNELTDELLLYESKDLLTHAVCIGMTGSGKTGLCVSIIEEAAIDGIPVIAIDPKGDIANALLTFPELKPADFEPWVNAEEAQRNKVSVQDQAGKIAADWRNGLAQWGQTPERISRLKESAEFAIYTPGARFGRPVSLLRSFAAPPPAMLDDRDYFRDKINATVTSLLALMQVEADALSKEYVLLATILTKFWSEQKDVNFDLLIQAIQKPPFTQVGAIDLESFYPSKERFQLSIQLNNVIASPGFEVWTQGEPLDVGNILYSQHGKPRVSIFSIAHLNDTERMFFVSVLLSELVGWMRTQSGTTSLRAMFYMDEIAGYLPPVANPPSKQPMMLLLKQARAFGLGILLATQNPVDIDYKALSNMGTWFIGRLQTERDKARLLDGLEGAAGSTGASFDRQEIQKILSSLTSRTFFMNNIHDDEPTIFKTRWTLSYLKGPLSREEIRKLQANSGSAAAAAAEPKPVGAGSANPAPPPVAAPAMAAQPRTALPPEVPQFYLPVRKVAANAKLVYEPQVLGIGNIKFVDTKAEVDTILQYAVLGPANSLQPDAIDWSQSKSAKVWMEDLSKEPEPDADFVSPPSAMCQPKSYSSWSKEFVNWLFLNKSLNVFRSDITETFSKPRETEKDFRVRLVQSAREARDKASEALKAKYAPKLATLQNKLATAQQRIDREKAQLAQQQMDSALHVGSTILGAFMGRRTLSRSTIYGAASSARSVGRAAKQQQDVAQAEESVARIEEQINELNQQFSTELAELEHKMDVQTEELKTVSIIPKKTNISVALLGLAWCPYWVDANGTRTEAWLRS